jgi:hypothetical protein
MKTATQTTTWPKIIESKGLFLALNNNAENTVLGDYTSKHCFDGRSVDVQILDIGCDQIVILDRWQEGTYVVYLFDDEDQARSSFDTMVQMYRDEDDSSDE